MPENFMVVLIPIIFAAVIALIIYGILQEQKRRKALEEWARSKNWRFNSDKDYDFDNTYSGFSCLRKGSNRYAFNIIRGELENHRVEAFDYHYETHSTDSKGRRKTHHHKFSAVIIQTPWPLKPLLIRPEGFFDKLTEFFGFDDIDFESSEFSKKFFVKSPDKKWAYDVIHQETMEYLLNAPRYTLEFENRHIIAFMGGKRFDIPEFEGAIEIIQGVVNRFPEYLVKELEGALS